MTHLGSRKSVRVTALLLSAALVAGSCGWFRDGDDAATPAPDGTESGIASQTPGLATSSLGIRLSEGVATVAAPLSVVAGSTLTDAQVAAVIDRLPEWDIPDEAVDFNRPAESLKPPLVGATVDTAFPPPTDAAPPSTPTDGPLEVLRFQPEGDVALAPFLSVTFNQPMVPLATLEQLDSADIPIVMTPEVPGRWRNRRNGEAKWSLHSLSDYATAWRSM